MSILGELIRSNGYSSVMDVYSSEAFMDALKQVLHLLRLEARMFYRLELAAPWGIELSVWNGAAFHLVEQGDVLLRMNNSEQALPLYAGDLIVISNVETYTLIDHASGEVMPLRELLTRRDKQGIVRMLPVSDGERTTLICGEFRPEYEVTYPLFSLLPPLILIRGNQGQAADWLTTSLNFIAFEVKENRPGSETVVSRLMDILFIMVIRYWIDHQPPHEGGWLAALYHPLIGEVLGAIHRQPEQDWTVESLAAKVHLSRSTLAALFTALVGESPIKYLTRWRMQMALMLLVNHPNLTIEEIAHHVGYSSPYAFSKAFKRLMGLAPNEYRRVYLDRELNIHLK